MVGVDEISFSGPAELLYNLVEKMGKCRNPASTVGKESSLFDQATFNEHSLSTATMFGQEPKLYIIYLGHFHMFVDPIKWKTKLFYF